MNLELTYHYSSILLAKVSGDFVAAQKNISDTITLDPQNNNNNASTAGYVLFNLFAQWKPLHGVAINAGIENIFDRHYINSLNGFNRVRDSDTAIGARLPGHGRNVFATINYQW